MFIDAVFIDAEKVITFILIRLAGSVNRQCSLMPKKFYFFGIELTVSLRTAPRSLTS